MKILIKNATTLKSVLGKGESGECQVNIIIDGEKIAGISESEISGNFDQTIDATDLFLSPGLCDPQVHFREPGMEYKEDIESGSRAAAKGGFTTVISMPNTTPTADNPETVKFMWDKQNEIGLCRVYPTGAVSMGLKGEELSDFKALKDAGAIAITDDGKGVQSDELFEKALLRAKEIDLPILDHSEDESLSQGGAIHLGEIAKKYKVKGIDANSESVHVKRGCELSGKTGAHYHVLHISTKSSIDYVKAAKEQGFRVTAEVSPHHLLLCDEDIPEKEDGSLNANWKMNPPLRSKTDRAACVEALIDGTIDAIATDHAPHAPDEKAREIEKAPFGIIGLETAFALIYTNFVKTGKITLDRCIHLMSKGAGDLFSLDIGRIEVGRAADLVLFDLKNSFEVTQDYFASKSKNSPFIGQKLYGRTKLTLFQGKEVYKDEL
ncbi:MAG: dihydroorotase [Halobacteriovoraceae bacterium]|nr:dihydroorotase [Halobacteriovoraceae bacterium]|tara:strand:+ start:21179 stop:22489 length:1311 start_codon:yes stop_codon:yes gene_type:complete